MRTRQNGRERHRTEVLQKCPSVHLHAVNIRVLLEEWNDLRVDCRQPLPNRDTSELPVIRQQSRISPRRIADKRCPTPWDLSSSGEESVCRYSGAPSYFNLEYSNLACLKMGMSGSASFHRVRKSRYVALALALSPCKRNARARPR
jgi:hypothetical protein